MKVRRVTTGHNAEGKAVVASDVTVDGIALTQLPGAEFHRLWGADVPPRFPDDGSEPKGRDYFPPLGGFRFMTFCRIVVFMVGTPREPSGVEVARSASQD
jgi:hypothetical protein